MPSVRKLFRSRKSKSCPSLDGGDAVPEDSLSEVSKELFEVVKPFKKTRRNSLTSIGRKPAKVLGRSLRNLLARRGGTDDEWTPASDKVPVFIMEDSSRTADMSESNPVWDQGSVTDTSLTMTPPRNPEKVALVMEEVQEEEAEFVDAVETLVSEEPTQEVEPVIMDATVEAVEEEKTEDNEAEETVNEVVSEEVPESDEAEADNENEDEDEDINDEERPEESSPEVVEATETEATEEDAMSEPGPEDIALLEEELKVEENSEEIAQTEALVEEQPAVVPMPPTVERSEDFRFLELLQGANLDDEEVNDEQVHRMVEEAALMVIEEEGEDDEEGLEEVAEATEEEDSSETESETASESSPESIDASKVRDSIAVAKKATAASNSSSLATALGVWIVLVCIVIGFLCLQETTDLILDMKDRCLALFDQAALESPEAAGNPARPLLQDACKGTYCGFY